MNLLFRQRFCGVMLGCLMAVASQGVAANVTQTINLAAGWNAFHLQVEPELSPTELFSSWPVDSVSLYDGQLLLDTERSATLSSDETTTIHPFHIWHRDNEAGSSLVMLLGDGVYVCYNTSGKPFSAIVMGRPVAPRLIWHIAEEDSQVLNYIGFSLNASAAINPNVYLEGADAGYSKLWRIGGTNEAKISYVYMQDYSKVRNGEVLLADATKVSQWSAPLYISPRKGYDFGTTEFKKDISVRNDSTSAKEVSMEWLMGSAGSVDDTMPRFNLKYRDISMVLTNSTWLDLTSKLTKTIAPGETWKLELGVDRSQFEGADGGTQYGGIMRIEDMSGTSEMRAEIGFYATAQIESKNDWPAGLWAGDLHFTNVSRVENDSTIVHGLSAGAPATVRLYLHVDASGVVRLLQRVVVAGYEKEDKTVDLGLYAGTADLPEDATQVVRLSSVVMPVDVPIVEGEGAFAKTMDFKFGVDANSPSSPFRHQYHPDHDGLQWDFKTPAPDGDDFNNFMGQVKPELFSVTNVVSITLDGLEGLEPWNPEDEVRGTCRWWIQNLRREGDILVDGTCIFTRVVPQGELIF